MILKNEFALKRNVELSEALVEEVVTIKDLTVTASVALSLLLKMELIGGQWQVLTAYSFKLPMDGSVGPKICQGNVAVT